MEIGTINSCWVSNSKFKIDLIVWKFVRILYWIVLIHLFKIDLIVWKYALILSCLLAITSLK